MVDIDPKRLDTIENNQQAIISMLKTLLRQRSSNKVELLETKVKEKLRMKTKEVMVFLGVQRQTALNIMEKLGEIPGFAYFVGDSASKRSSYIVYKKSEIYKKQLGAILDMISEKGMITFNDIMQAFSIDIGTAKSIANDFIKNHPNFEMKDDIKIVKK